MSNDELEKLEALADARTVDADVRAGLHSLALAFRSELARNRELEIEVNRDAVGERDKLREAVRGYVRECRNAAVLGPDRCRVDRYYTKLEQLT